MKTALGKLTVAASVGLALVVFGASPASAKKPAPAPAVVTAPSTTAWTGQTWTGQTWTGQTWTGQTWTGQMWR